MPSTVPSKLGPYEIFAPLGAGGMGLVYRARDTRLGRTVALKILPDEVSQDPHRQARFEQEARTASALNHPNVACIYDIGSDQGVLYVASELVEGESLRAIVARGPIPAPKFFEIAIQIAEGVSAAHTAGVVHRDLKPDNILLTRDGRVKIIDFGLAKQVDFPSGEQRQDAATILMTEPGIVIGTPAYMSPEQVRGQPADHRSDLFSFGTTLYEMAAGKKPFSGASAVEVMHSVITHDPDPLPPSVPRDLHLVIRRCMEKAPERRFQTAADLAFALERSREALTPERDLAPVAVSDSKPRRLLPVAMALAGVLVAGILAVVVLLNRPRPRAETPAPTQAISSVEPEPVAPPAITAPAPATTTAIAVPNPATTKLAAAAKLNEPAAVAPAPKRAPDSKSAAPAKQLPSPANVEHAKTVALGVAKALSEARYPDAAKNFENHPESGVTADRMRQNWESTRQEMGDFVWISPPYSSENSEFIWLERQRGVNDISVSFDTDGHASGIHVWFHHTGALKIDAAPQLNPERSIRAVEQGERLSGQGKWEDARKSYDEAVQFNPNFEEAFRGRCVALQQSGRYVPAILDCTHAIHLNPEDAVAHFWRGNALDVGLNFHDFGIAAYSESIRLKSDVDSVINHRAGAYLKVGQYDLCVADTTAAMNINPKNFHIFDNRSLCYARLQKYELAAEAAGHVVDLTNDPRQYNRRGSLYIQAKQYQRAIADFNEAIRMKPDYKDAYNNRGYAKDMLGDAAGAAADRKYARELP